MCWQFCLENVDDPNNLHNVVILMLKIRTYPLTPFGLSGTYGRTYLKLLPDMYPRTLLFGELIAWFTISTNYSPSPRRVRNGSAIKIEIELPAAERSSETKFPIERWKTCVALLFVLFNFVLTTTSLSITHELRRPQSKVLKSDVFFKKLQNIKVKSIVHLKTWLVSFKKPCFSHFQISPWTVFPTMLGLLTYLR